MLIQITQRVHRSRRYLALLILALTGLLALPLQAQHNHREPASPSLKVAADAPCPQHASALSMNTQALDKQAHHQPAPTHTEHHCQCLLACASAAAAIATTTLPPQPVSAGQLDFAYRDHPLPFSAPVPPYRPPITVASA